MHKKVLIIGSQHGNELLGINLFDYIKQHRPELLDAVEYICANPQAYEKHTRFIEVDMNRSYKSDGHGYEEDRAREILAHINKGDYAYVLDMHTTTAPIDGVFISAALTQENIPIINASDLEKIVIMPPHIVEHALIGNVGPSISIEFNEELARQEDTLAALSDFVNRLVTSESVQPKQRKIYHVSGFIGNDEDTDGIHNFELTPTGYYPVLYGEANYTKYKGFKANQVTRQSI